MKGKLCFFNRKVNMLKRLIKISENKSGSILSLVIIIGAALFIITSGLLMTVANTNAVTKNVDNSENAYLAARSGITLLADAGKDSAFAQKIVDSMGQTDPIKLDFGDQGKCEAVVTDMGDAADGSGVVYKTAKVECTGMYEGSSFKLTRYFKLKQSGTAKTNELKTCAYLHYGDGDMIIDGGIEGNVYIIGNGHIQNDKANVDHPMHDVVCSNELVLSNSGCVYNLIAAGRYLVLGEALINTEVYVGSNKLDIDGKFTSELNDGIYAYLHGSTVSSVLRCEGVTVIGGYTSINSDNAIYDAADNVVGVFNSSQPAVISGGDLYLGYNVTNTSTYNPGDSYKNSASTVNTKDGLTGGDNAGQVIYGGIVSGGDVYIDSTVEIYGDIIALGDVTINTNCTIHGNIYAGGNVVLSSAMNTSLAAAFPDSTKRVIEAGGTVTFNSPNIKRADFNSVSENVSPVTNHSLYFNGSDFVGAADYFKTQYESAPKPTTNIPARLYSLVETKQSETNIQIETAPCYSDCGERVLDMSQKCNANYWWHPDCNPTDENIAKGWWSADGITHYEHYGVYTHPWGHLKATTDPPTQISVTTTMDKIHITEDARLVGDFNLPDENYKLYIDTSVNNQDIDILLEGNINVGNGGIFVNDNGGANQIRIFMTEGSSINLNSTYGPNYKCIYTISDAAKNTDIGALPSTSSSSCIDIQKVPQLYIFAQEGKDNITLDAGTYGYIPGYVLTPYLNIKTDSNAHCYVTGSPIGKNPTNITQESTANYPFFYGMLMCNSLEFHQGTNTFVKYDWRLDDVQDPTDPTKMVKSETRKKFDLALARDNVMQFASSSTSSSGSSSSVTYTWSVDSCY